MRDQARAAVVEAVNGVHTANSRLDDAVGLAVDAGLSWVELSEITGIYRQTISKKWRHRRRR